MSVKKYILKNGLKVLLIENHKSPVVSVQMWVRTGSSDEKKSQEGISHFIEHLVFKGTNKYKVGEIAATVEGSGGELNAYTSFDQTVFYVTISKEFTDVGLDVISEMMGFPKFDSDEIDNEREVVLEEIKRGNDSPGRQASRLLFSTVYKKHPYGIPVIGYDKVIKKVSKKVLVEYFQSRYVPTNMHLVVAGDFQGSEMRKKINSLFGKFENFKLKPVKRAKEPKQKLARIKVESCSFEEAHLYMAWPIPGLDHKDIPALDLLGMILGTGESSRLIQKLRMQEPLCNSVGAGTFTPKEQGLFMVYGQLNPENLSKTMSILQTELERIMLEAPSAAEIRRAITNLESDEFYALETVDGLARKAGSFEHLMSDHDYFKKYLRLVRSVKAVDISRVARKYFNPKAMSLVLMAKGNKAPLENQLKKWQKDFQKSVEAIKKQKIVEHKEKLSAAVNWKSQGRVGGKVAIEKLVLKTGAQILFRPTFDTPVLSVRAAFLGGLRTEGRENLGLTDLLSRVWTSGTAHLSEQQIQAEIEDIAGGLSAFGGRNSVGLSLQALAPFEKRAGTLFEEVLARAVISEQAVEREKLVKLEEIRSREDNPAQIASQKFMENLFHGHAYALDMLGTRESVKKLNKKCVETFLEQSCQTSNLVIALAGAVDRDYWLELFESATSRLQKGKVKKFADPLETLKSDKFEFSELKKEQSHIMVGYRGLSLSDSDRYVLQIIQSILAGQGGRLFLELRDKASLAYSVSPMRMEGIETGYFGAYIGCTPNKGPKALEMLDIEFKKLTNDLVGEAELERAKRYLIGRHDIDIQRASAIGSSMLFNELYGIPAEEAFKYSQSLAGISAQDVRRVAKKIFDQHKVVVAVGPEKPW